VIANAWHAFSTPIGFVDQTYSRVDGAVIAYHYSIRDHDPKSGVNMKPATNDRGWMNVGTGKAGYEEVDDYAH
jgi:hypothetical protein